jgi:hypothetical protein
MSSTVTIEELLNQKFENYIKFLMASSLCPQDFDKLLNPNIKNIPIMIKIVALCKTYEFYVSEGKFLFDEWFNNFWIKKYKVDKTIIKEDELEKFKKYHLMFYDLTTKYKKILENTQKKYSYVQKHSYVHLCASEFFLVLFPIQLQNYLHFFYSFAIFSFLIYHAI